MCMGVESERDRDTRCVREMGGLTFEVVGEGGTGVSLLPVGDGAIAAVATFVGSVDFARTCCAVGARLNGEDSKLNLLR